MPSDQQIHFALQLTYDQFLQVYQGNAKNISVIADDGRRIIFPARNIQSFLSKDGISGYFQMSLTSENKFINLKKIR